MRKHILYTLSLICFCFITPQSFAQTKARTFDYFTNSPIVISIKNLQNGSRWQLSNTKNSKELLQATNPANSVGISSKREGYIFSYFTMKIPFEFKGAIVFDAVDSNGKVMDSRTFNFEPKDSKIKGSNPLFGDVPTESKGDGFLDQAENKVAQQNIADEKSKVNNSPINPKERKNPVQDNTIIDSRMMNPTLEGPTSPNQEGLSSEPQEDGEENNQLPEEEVVVPVPVPEKMKSYIQTLLNAQLFDQARKIFSDYLKENPTNEREYELTTDIKISEGAKNYQEIVDKINPLLNIDFSFKEPIRDEVQFILREKLAFALESLNKVKDAETQLLYLNVYFKDNPYTDYYLGKFYLRQKQLEKATSHFMLVINKTPDFPYADEIYYQLGYYYYSVVGVTGYNLSLNYYKKVLEFGLASSYYAQSKKIVDFLEANFFNNY